MSEHSTLVFVLKAFLPYTRENLMLSFKPARFFAELAQISGHSQATLTRSYYHARRTGLLTHGPVPALTAKGSLKLAPFVATKLGEEARLMIIFDIPEHSSLLRQRLRRLLKNLHFRQVQKSVWVTNYDHRAVISSAVQEMNLDGYVEIYECLKLPVKAQS